MRPADVVGRRVLRTEDPALLTGQARYTSDFDPPGALHLVIVRSPQVHGRITAIDTTEAEALPGVHAVITGTDLQAAGVHPIPLHSGAPVQRNTANPALALGKVFYVGQPVAAVVADTAYIAEDAAELVQVDIEPLPAITSVEQSLDPAAPILHEEWGCNVAAEFGLEGGDVDAAFASPDIVIERTFYIHRHTGVPMEPRAATAVHDPASGLTTMWASTQSPQHVRTALCEILGWQEHQLRLVAPHVGGGFGTKEYPACEDVLVCWLAKKLRRPIRWVEDRRENLLSTHAREMTLNVEMAADAEGHVKGVRGVIHHDIGGYCSNVSIAASIYAAGMMPGPYRLPNYKMDVLGVVTNKTPAGSYRGMGQPQAAWVIERLMDDLAERAGVDRVEIRRRNLLRRDELPYRSASGHLYDSGDYHEALDLVLQEIDYASIERLREDAASRGRKLGLGIGCFVMSFGLGPSAELAAADATFGAFETAQVRMDSSGSATVFMGTSSQGQGHATTFAQLAAAQLGLDPERDIRVVQGDTESTPYGSPGAIGSRVAHVGGAAVMLAAEKVADKVKALAAHLLEAAPDDIELRDRRAVVRGSESRGITLADVGMQAHLAHNLPEGMDPGLEAIASFDPPNSTFPYASHAAIVEIDPETGALEVLRYVVVHDSGVLINPMIVEGQIVGAVAQGVGGAVLEEFAYGPDGQPLATSFMDYLLPTVAEVPPVDIKFLCTPAPGTPHGVKGVGEAGILGPAPVLASAVCDALSVPSDSISSLPLKPEAIWDLAASSSRV